MPLILVRENILFFLWGNEKSKKGYFLFEPSVQLMDFVFFRDGFLFTLSLSLSRSFFLLWATFFKKRCSHFRQTLVQDRAWENSKEGVNLTKSGFNWSATYLPTQLLTHLSFYLLIHLPTYPSTYLLIFLYTYLTIYLSIYVVNFNNFRISVLLNYSLMLIRSTWIVCTMYH